ASDVRKYIVNNNKILNIMNIDNRFKILIGLIFLIVGCESPLDREPLDTISSDLIWNDQVLANGYMATIYTDTEFIQGMDNTASIGEPYQVIGVFGGEYVGRNTDRSNSETNGTISATNSFNPAVSYWKWDHIRNINIGIEQLESGASNLG